MSSSWNFPSWAEPSWKVSEPSRAELEVFIIYSFLRSTNFFFMDENQSFLKKKGLFTIKKNKNKVKIRKKKSKWKKCLFYDFRAERKRSRAELSRKSFSSSQLGSDSSLELQQQAMLWELNARNVHYPRSLGFGGDDCYWYSLGVKCVLKEHSYFQIWTFVLTRYIW